MNEAPAGATSGGLRASLVGAFEAARAAGDPERLAAAALALPSTRGFGEHSGQIPVLLHEARLATSARSRAAHGNQYSTEMEMSPGSYVVDVNPTEDRRRFPTHQPRQAAGDREATP